MTGLVGEGSRRDDFTSIEGMPRPVATPTPELAAASISFSVAYLPQTIAVSVSK